MSAPTSRPIDLVLDRLGQRSRVVSSGPNQWKARCPGHDDRQPSLSISIGQDDRVLLNCHAGCPVERIVAGMNLEEADLFAPRQERTQSRPRPTEPAFTPIAYNYCDADGTVVFQAIRKQYQDGRKKFSQRRPKPGGGWFDNLNGVTPMLYRLPELLAADPNDLVFVVEGEKDVERLRALGAVATCNPMGAGKWRDAYVDALRNRYVVIIADNDRPGLDHAFTIGRSLDGVAAMVVVVKLTNVPAKGDVSDFLDNGGTLPMLVTAVEGNPVNGIEVVEPMRFPAAPNDALPNMLNDAHAPNDEHLNHLSGEVSILGRVRFDEVAIERIDWLSPGRLAAGKLTMVDGDPGLGKSTVLLDWAALVTRGRPLPDGPARGPRGVVVMSAEDGIADTAVPRAAVAGADLSRIVAITEMADGSLPTIPANLPEIEAIIRDIDAALLIIDPLVAFLGDDVNSNRDQDVRRALAPLKGMAERTGVAVAMVRHLNKMNGTNATYRGGGSIGLIGAARFGLLFARDPDDVERCLIAAVKSNLSRPATTLAYTLDSVDGTDVARVNWLGESSMTASNLLATPSDEGERTALDEAKEFLVDLLREDAHPVKTVKAAAREAGISDVTLRRAKDVLRVEAVKEGFGAEGHWRWKLPAKMLNESLRILRRSSEMDRAPLSTLVAANGHANGHVNGVALDIDEGVV